jgi:PEP-CTERM motif
MLRISVFVLRLRLQAAILSMFIAFFVFASGAAAALLDLNVANGDYNDSGNWINYTTNDTTAVPTTADDAIVRNGGTLNITAADGDASAAVIRIGAGAQAGDPAGPLSPPAPYGGGTLNWTGGNILGGANGPRLNVGERDNANNINYTGIVNHSGGKISLNANASFLVIGSNGTTPTPTSIYNLMPGGTIGLVAGAGNTNNGINVRNGTFNMTGGSIVSDSLATGQRFMTISSTSGTLGSENVATANFSGGIVNVNSGLRMASSSHTKAYATISGTADIKMIGSDFQLGANATNAYAQVDMSAGMLRVGDAVLGDQRRLIVGDAGTGVFNMSGGTATINHSFVVANNATAKGTFYQTGGTFTVRDIETNRNSPAAADLTVENAAIIIDGPSAVFNQQNTTSLLTGEFSLGQFGNSRFELRQGQANIRVFEVSNNPESRATLNVFGGKLTLQDGVIRNNVSAGNTPNINLTGGELELTPAGGAMSWQANMHLLGTDFDPKPGAVMLTNVGSSPSKPADFSLNSGSVWDLDIANGTLSGADWVDVPIGTAALNGGLLNLHLIGGYTPAIGDTVRIVRQIAGALTLNLTGLAVSDPTWQPILAAGGTEIHLTYVPEPSSMLLFGIGLAMLSAPRRTSRK